MALTLEIEKLLSRYDAQKCDREEALDRIGDFEFGYTQLVKRIVVPMMEDVSRHIKSRVYTVKINSEHLGPVQFEVALDQSRLSHTSTWMVRPVRHLQVVEFLERTKPMSSEFAHCDDGRKLQSISREFLERNLLIFLERVLLQK